MLESFSLKKNWARVEQLWREKNLISSEILGQLSLRQMRPELIGDRRRLDLMCFQSKLGIRGRSRADGTFEFFELEEVDSVPDEILKMVESFKALRPSLELAQLRFRLGVNGERGLWIDIANLEIKRLLEESLLLNQLLEAGFIVEMGQKHKEVQQKPDGTLSLEPLRPRPWLASYGISNQEIPLLSAQSLFSQPGPEVNRALIATAFDLLDESQINQVDSWCEWGAGYGNLTAAFAEKFPEAQGWASEYEPFSASLLTENAKSYFSNVRVEQQAAESGRLPQGQLWIADPPRSGFPKLFAKLGELPQLPRWILTFHCHQNGLLADQKEIRKSGYKLLNWSSVDAFPATPHHEVISLWEAP